MTEEQCREHADRLGKMATDVAVIKGDVKHLSHRINGAMDKIADHIGQGEWWRGAIIGMLITIVISIIAATMAYGEMRNQVDVNTKRWDRLFSRLGDNIDVNHIHGDS